MPAAAFHTANSLALPSRSGLSAKNRVAPQLRSAVSRRPQAKALQASMEATRMETSTTSETSPSTSKPVTVEEQRVIAKNLVKYFEDKQYDEEYQKSRTFGWTYEAELANGRWVMFGLMVGLMTEYATGVDFVDQIRITITNLGFADVYE